MAKKDTGPAKTYTVASPIEHDKEHYAVGETIELSEPQAAALLAVGAVEAPAEKAPPKSEGK
ncbi:MAG: hypothetical protein AB7Q97_27285 [Gammaproteobacteria bacterium]